MRVVLAVIPAGDRAIRGEVDVAADVFDQRHLIALYQRGLINELPIELGPMPVFDLGPSVDEDLKRWNIVDPSTNELTEPAQEYFAGLVGYEWAVWGIVLLYNQRMEIVSDLPEEFLQYGVQYAIRDVPRVSFLIGYREGTFTTATLAAGQLALATDRARSNTDEHRNEAVGQIIMAILDPQKQWKPHPMERISIPAAAAEALKRDRTDDTEDVLETTRDGLRDAGMARTTVRGLAELLSQDNVAVSQITISRRAPQGKQTVYHNAMGVMFFVGEPGGVVVSYPSRGLDGRQWINYEPATPAAMTEAVAALRRGLAKANPEDITLR